MTLKLQPTKCILSVFFNKTTPTHHPTVPRIYVDEKAKQKCVRPVKYITIFLHAA